jgi:hypothetical protein
MDIGVAKHMTKIDASIFLIDCDWNMNAGTIAAKTIPLVRYLRTAHPETPIVLAEGSDWPATWVRGDAMHVADKRKALEAAYANLTQAGDKNLHLVQGPDLYGDDQNAQDSTFNNVHPTDLGHSEITKYYTTMLPKLLAGELQRKEVVLGDDLVRDRDRKAATKALGPTEAPEAAAPQPGMPGMEAAEDTMWMDVAGLGVEGRAFNDTPSIYNRLPSSAKPDVRSDVWSLSLMSAGLFVRFETNSSSISLNYTLGSAAAHSLHFPASGKSGCDLYARSYATGSSGSYKWRFVGSAFQQLEMGSTNQIGVVATDLQPGPGANKMRSFLLYLPTYNTVVQASVGVPGGKGYAIQRDSQPGFARKASIVWYGTSILQGGVAERVGNIFTHKIARRINRTIFNFGFSMGRWSLV